jgi:hypothetical protein
MPEALYDADILLWSEQHGAADNHRKHLHEP